jgi:hypothetical protein
MVHSGAGMTVFDEFTTTGVANDHWAADQAPTGTQTGPLDQSLEQAIRAYIVAATMDDPDVSDARVKITDYLMRHRLLGYDEMVNMPTGSLYSQINGGWVMGTDADGAPFRDVETLGTCLVAAFVADEWAQPSLFRSSQYPRLHLQVWSDRTRDGDGQPTGVHDAEDRARAVWRLLHPLFHDPGNVIHAFGGPDPTNPSAPPQYVRVHSTSQGGTWTIMGVPGTDGVVRADCVYNLHID